MDEDLYFLKLAEFQGKLYSFIRSLHSFPHEVDDIVQEANLTIIKKRVDFDNEKDFIPWAYAIARFTWMAYKQKRARQLQKISNSSSSSFLRSWNWRGLF